MSAGLVGSPLRPGGSFSFSEAGRLVFLSLWGEGGVSASPLGSGDLSLGRSGKGGRGWGEGKGKDVLRSDEAKKRRSKDCEEWKKGVETTEGLQAFVALSFFFFGARKAAGSQAHKKVELIAPCWKADRQLLACVAWGVLE